MITNRRKLVLLFVLLMTVSVNAQEDNRQTEKSVTDYPPIAVKVDLLTGIGTLTPNFGVELGLTPKTSLELMLAYHPWHLNSSPADHKKLIHRRVQANYRYWFNQTWNGAYAAFGLAFTHYNIAGYKWFGAFDKNVRNQGDSFGAGLSLGYHWRWSDRWGMEFSAGVGAALLDYDKFRCTKCGEKLGHQRDIYYGLTDAAVKIVYKLPAGKRNTAQQTWDASNELINADRNHSDIKEQTMLPEQPIVPAQPQPQAQPEQQQPRVVQPSVVAAWTEWQPRNIYFELGQSELKLLYRDNALALEELVREVERMQKQSYADQMRLTISGYTSPEGTTEQNKKLAHDRATAVKDYLVSRTGISDARLMEQAGEEQKKTKSTQHYSDMRKVTCAWITKD